MSDLDDRERQAYATVDDALKTFPLSPVSPALYMATMARVRAAQPVPRFRLRWIDYALIALAVAMVSAVLVLWRMIPVERVFPVEMFHSIQVDMLFAVQGFTPAILVPTLCAGLILVIAAVCALAILSNKPSRRYVIRHR